MQLFLRWNHRIISSIWNNNTFINKWSNFACHKLVNSLHIFVSHYRPSSWFFILVRTHKEIKNRPILSEICRSCYFEEGKRGVLHWLEESECRQPIITSNGWAYWPKEKFSIRSKLNIPGELFFIHRRLFKKKWQKPNTDMRMIPYFIILQYFLSFNPYNHLT